MQNKVILIKELFMLILFGLISLNVNGQGKWQKIGGKDFNFEIEMFAFKDMVSDTQIIDQQEIVNYRWVGGNIFSNIFSSEYGLFSTKYPESYIHSDSSFQLITEFLNSTTFSIGENPEYEFIHGYYEFLNGYPGKQFKFKNINSGGLTELHVYLVKSQLLVLIANSKAENWFSHSKTRFFESIKLIDVEVNSENYGVRFIKDIPFKADFPEEPTVRNAIADSEIGLLNTRISIAERKVVFKGNKAFMVAMMVYPEWVEFGKDSIETYFKHVAEGSAYSTNGNLKSFNRLDKNGMDGYEYEISIFNGKAINYTWSGFDRKEKILYSVGVIHNNSKLNKEAKRFINSFELIEHDQKVEE